MNPKLSNVPYLTGDKSFTSTDKLPPRHGDCYLRPYTIQELLSKVDYLPQEMCEFLIKTGCDNPKERCDAREALELLHAMRDAGVRVFKDETGEIGGRPSADDFKDKIEKVGLQYVQE